MGPFRVRQIYFFHPVENLLVLLVLSASGTRPDLTFVHTFLLDGCFRSKKQWYHQLPVYHIRVLPDAVMALIIHEIPEACLWLKRFSCTAKKITPHVK